MRYVFVGRAGIFGVISVSDMIVLLQRPGSLTQRMMHDFLVIGSQSPFLVMPLLGLAKVLKSSGRVTEAMETYQRSITILEKTRGPMSEDLVLPLSCMGNLYIDEGRAVDAKATFSR